MTKKDSKRLAAYHQRVNENARNRLTISTGFTPDEVLDYEMLRAVDREEYENRMNSN